MNRHHPDTLTLMEFSAGNLSEPHALCIRLHLDQCSHCRSRVDTLDSLGAVMMENQPQVGVSSDMFDTILSRIDGDADDASRRVSTQPKAQKRIGALQKLLGDDLNALPWKRQLGDVSVLDISERFPGQNEQVVLQKLAAGGKAPSHTHRGEETTIVLVDFDVNENFRLQGNPETPAGLQGILFTPVLKEKSRTVDEG